MCQRLQGTPPGVKRAFGLHLTLDGYGCPLDRLANLGLIYKFLDNTPDLIHMTKIMPPYVFKCHGKVPEDWEVSGFVLIAESHISIHTFPDKGYLSLDIFSCKPFDIDLAVHEAVEVFGIRSFEKNMFDRGLEFPRNVRAVAGIITSQRQSMCEGSK